MDAISLGVGKWSTDNIKSYFSSEINTMIYRVLLIGLGATLTLTGLQRSINDGILSADVFLLPTSASGTARAMLISTLQASDHTWCDRRTVVSKRKLWPVVLSMK